MIPLASTRPGQIGTVARTCDDPKDAALLRAMGLRPNAVVRVCRLGEPCIVEVLGSCADGGEGACRCRIGISRPLAMQIVLAPSTAPRNSDAERRVGP